MSSFHCMLTDVGIAAGASCHVPCIPRPRMLTRPMSIPDEHPTEKVALNADIVGYSRLMADDSAATTAAVTELRRLVADEVAAQEGTLLNFVGDNFMALFDEAQQAVHAAIAITALVEAGNSAVSPERTIRFRMGIDGGPVTFAGGDVHGDALNIAARIQALARPGGIDVSGRVYRALDEPALRFRALGPQRLKNIPEAIDVYEFADLPSDGSHASGLGTLMLEPPTVAVLQIHTERTDADVAAAAGVIRADLLHRLAAMPDLRLIDAGTISGGTPPPSLARYVLETGVHQVGDRVRVYATLFDVTTMNVVKSLRWEATATTLLDLADDVSHEVARSIEIDLVVGAPAGLYAELDDPVSIEQVYLGWYHLRSDTPEGWGRALEHFGEVARAHPDQPYGHVLLAFAMWIGATSGWADPETALPAARAYASDGMRIGDPTGMGMAVDAAVLMTMGRFDEAIEELERVEIARPTCDVTFGLEGSVRRYLGQWEEAIERLDIAMRLTGINKPWYPTVKACSLFIGRRLEPAASLAEMVLEYQPNNLEALLILTAAQVELGSKRRARATAERIRATFPAVDIDEWLARNPYQDGDIGRRWRADLASVGLVPTP
jgi:adenylate cyclase